MILRAVALSLGQIGDPRFRRVVFIGIGLTAALLIILCILVIAGIRLLVPASLTLPFTSQEIGSLDTLASLGGVAAFALLSVFLMAPVATAFIGLFLEQVADAVEARHYDWLPAATGPSLWQGLRESLTHFIVMIALNLLAILVFVFSGGIGIIAIWLANGYLLGREYFTFAARRRLSASSTKRLRQIWHFRIWLTGILLAIPLSLPVINFFVPVIGAAVFTHLFHFITLREGMEQRRYPRNLS